MTVSKLKLDFVGILVVILVLTWAASSIIEVWRGTAHVGGCSCIVHVDHATDAGTP